MTVWNRDKSKVDSVTAQGATIADSAVAEALLLAAAGLTLPFAETALALFRDLVATAAPDCLPTA